MTHRIRICIAWTFLVAAFICSWFIGSWIIGLTVLALSRIIVPLSRRASLLFWSGLLVPVVWFLLFSAVSGHLPEAPSMFHSLWTFITYLVCVGPVISVFTAAIADATSYGGSRAV